MCRWLAYSGSPVLLEDLLYKPQNSLVVQGQHSRLGATATNGDGFGVGWYTGDGTPGLFRSTEPVWNDRNLRELCAHARASRVFAHIRASTGSAVQQTNCHPFRHGQWLWMHNGALQGFREMKRDLTLAVDPELFPDIEGSTDSEMLFFLAMTYGLAQDPAVAVAKAVGLVEDVGRRHGIDLPVQMTVATTDGDTTWAFRYSSEGRSRSLFKSADVSTSGRSTRTTRCCTNCRTTPISWCPNPWATCAARGSRYPSRRTSSCTAAPSRRTPSLPSRRRRPGGQTLGQGDSERHPDAGHE